MQGDGGVEETQTPVTAANKQPSGKRGATVKRRRGDDKLLLNALLRPSRLTRARFSLSRCPSRITLPPRFHLLRHNCFGSPVVQTADC